MSLINKEALISQFNELCVGECCCCRHSTTTGSGCKVIDDAPEVEPRNLGHWIRRPKRLPNGNYHYECSICGMIDEHNEMIVVPYCWNCGARIVEVDDDSRRIESDTDD